MSLATYVMRNYGINVSLESVLGSMLPPNGTVSPWTGGFILHLVVGGMAGMAYAFMFEVALQRSGPLMGAGIGLAHGMFAGLLMSGIPAMNPLDPHTTSAPGAFLSNMTLGPVMYLLLHCIYGATVGTLYGAPIQKQHLYHGRPV
jgi:hypothetical protein